MISAMPSWLSWMSVIALTNDTQRLAPPNDISLVSEDRFGSPLQYLGANSPYYAGPNVFDINSNVPDDCTVQQAAYFVRHGSRFPDTSAYNSWLALQQKIQIAVDGVDFQASGALGFISDWNVVLSDPNLQIAQESMTGWKEASDLGYQLRARYPHFYQDGSPFHVWANAYTNPVNESRVVQTARAFLHGYLYEFVDTNGSVVSVNSTGSVSAIGNSLGPSDSCPKFAATSSGGDNVTDWNNSWLPQALARINAMVRGNLTFSESDVLLFPYLCGFESQITGTLSPWCGVLNEEELQDYAYAQDLQYYYSVGPGATGPAPILFLPFLDSLLALLIDGPNQTGIDVDGKSEWELPRLIMGFLNDNQLAEMTAAMGLFDGTDALSLDKIPSQHIYNVGHFITMRGTVAFEVLDCSSQDLFIRVLLNDAVYLIPNCQNGPGGSCPLATYASYIHEKSISAGSFIDYCNVTASNHPISVAGASFFQNLSQDFLQIVKP